MPMHESLPDSISEPLTVADAHDAVAQAAIRRNDRYLREFIE